MATTRRATRNTVGSELSAEQVRQTYAEVLHSRAKIKRAYVLRLIKQFFERDEVEVEVKRVSLECPLSKARIKDAARGSLCKHIECFDLKSYLDYHTRLAFWECPFTFCRQQVHCDQLRVDEYMTDVIRNIADTVTEIDVLSDGAYKPVEVTAPLVVKTIADEESFVNAVATEPWIKMEEEEIFDEPEPVLAEPQESDQDANTGSDSFDVHRDHSQPTPAKRFQCPDCSKSFNFRAHLDTHMRIHTGEKPFECDVCHKRFRQEGGLTVHFRTHTGEKPFKCGHCERSFVTRTHRRVHERSHTGEKPYSCQYCSQKFAQPGGLTSHLKTHSQERPFDCTICGRRFKHAQYVAAHERLHADEKPFECKECGKRFKMATGLHEHSKIHKSEKPFKCNVCGRTFCMRKRLLAHQAIHSDERPYKCEQCPKSYKWTGGLIAHRRLHKGEKPFKCDECDAAFTYESGLKNHKRHHRGEERPAKRMKRERTEQ